ncbi:MAG: hypothetical protein B7Y41_13335 [Hydrogenophilales bacterium 28-61-23]|nr:MAG: hypothetical protein B7Y41_13335 [Hydrogenophilales bacterium 28-61-23]
MTDFHPIFKTQTGSHCRQKGVTLIELMIAVMILGILAAIAYPSYMDHVAKANRAEMTGILLENAQFLERNYTTANRYDTVNSDGSGGAPAIVGQSPKTGVAKYNIAPNYGAAPAQTFTLTATRAGTMANDDCGNFTLTQAGVQGLVSNDASMTVAECW